MKLGRYLFFSHDGGKYTIPVAISQHPFFYLDQTECTKEENGGPANEIKCVHRNIQQFVEEEEEIMGPILMTYLTMCVLSKKQIIFCFVLDKAI